MEAGSKVDRKPAVVTPAPREAAAIEVEALSKRFGEVVALDGLDLVGPEGEVLGLLGPNGAGKTTLVRALATLLVPDSGRAIVLGRDAGADPFGVRREIGLAGQFAASDEILTGRENLELVGRLYQLGPGWTQSAAPSCGRWCESSAPRERRSC